jgi:hypothetical protein
MRVGEAFEIASLDGAMATLGWYGMVSTQIMDDPEIIAHNMAIVC